MVSYNQQNLSTMIYADHSKNPLLYTTNFISFISCYKG